MEKYLKTEIKSVIGTFPEVGKILERFGIGCVPCTVGTCQLGDVVKIHGLPPQKVAEMMYLVEKAIYPLRDIPLPKATATTTKEPPKAIRYSPPLKRLVDEHAWIKRVLALVPEMVAAMRAANKIDVELIKSSMEFIRGYADRFHHLKEEEILFDYTDKNAEVIKVIFQDHEQGRGFIRDLVAGLEKGDLEMVCRSLSNYRDLLTEHIRKEDEVLYPFIDRQLSTRQVGELFNRFNEVDGASEADIPRKFLDFTVAIEARFKPNQTLKAS